MPTTRAEMDDALKRLVIPELRKQGFRGSMPHFRRQRNGTCDLLSFQFRSSGGLFVIEIGRFPLEGIQHSWKFLPPEKVKNSDLAGRPLKKYRYRLGSPWPGAGDYWFMFEKTSPDDVAREVLDKLPPPEFWDEIEISTGRGPVEEHQRLAEERAAREAEG